MKTSATKSAFWEKPLSSLDRGEWEALCDGCGRCCLHKLEDEETGRSSDQCRLQAARPAQRPVHRLSAPQALVADCVMLDRKKLDELEWLPATCAYRLRWEGKPLPRLALSDLGQPRDGA